MRGIKCTERVLCTLHHINHSLLVLFLCIFALDLSTCLALLLLDFFYTLWPPFHASLSLSLSLSIHSSRLLSWPLILLAISFSQSLFLHLKLLELALCFHFLRSFSQTLSHSSLPVHSRLPLYKLDPCHVSYAAGHWSLATSATEVYCELN